MSWSQPWAPAAAMRAMPAARSGGGGRRFGLVLPQDGLPPPSRSGRCLKPDRTVSAPVWAWSVADGLYIGRSLAVFAGVGASGGRSCCVAGCFARASAMARFIPHAQRDSADESWTFMSRWLF